MSQKPHTVNTDTSGSPGLLGGALALAWFGIMTYGPLATWGAEPLLKQTPGFLVMLAAVAVFPALGLWMLAGAWRTAWSANVRLDHEADRLRAELRDLRDDVAALSTHVAMLSRAAPEPKSASTKASAPAKSAAPAPPSASAPAAAAPTATPTARPRVGLEISSLRTTLSVPAHGAAVAAKSSTTKPHATPALPHAAAPIAAAVAAAVASAPQKARASATPATIATTAAPAIKGFAADDTPAKPKRTAPRRRKASVAEARPLQERSALNRIVEAPLAPEPPPVTRRPPHQTRAPRLVIDGFIPMDTALDTRMLASFDGPDIDEPAAPRTPRRPRRSAHAV